MNLKNMEVKRVDEGVIVVQQHMKDETGCYVSKASDDSIEGRYLHALAGAVVEVQPKAQALQTAVNDYLLALDQWENTNKAERRVKMAEIAMRNALAATKEPKP